MQNSKSASLKDGVLTMKGVTADTLYFSDRPERITGRVTTQKFVAMTGYIFLPRQENLWVDFVALNGVIHKSTAACSVIQANKARGPCG